MMRQYTSRRSVGVRGAARMAAWMLAGWMLMIPMACDNAEQGGKATTQPAQGKPADPAPVASLTAGAIHAAIQKDRTGTKEKYQGELLEVEGVVDEYYFNKTAEKHMLRIGEMKDGKLVNPVECFIQPADEALFKALKPGQRVKVRGECSIDLILVYLSECKLVEKP
ncbi:MAG: tRNA_anti-like protein [Planctomycetes bacterium ADurb.Bin126]|nr:MAG: tRNA_anti-like protein [Planctomycetes bacterium ADurb.Bin126]